MMYTAGKTSQAKLENGEPRMTPNRPSHAYALYARRPIVPQPPDVLAADPPAGQEPLPPSGTEVTRRHQRQRWSIRPMVLVSPAPGSKSEGNLSTAQGGVARKF